MSVFAVPFKTAGAAAAPTAGLTPATAAGAFAAKPAAAPSPRSASGFAVFSFLRFTSLDATAFGSPPLSAPADFRGAVAAFAGASITTALREAAMRSRAGLCGASSPFLAAFAEIMRDAPDFLAAARLSCDPTLASAVEPRDADLA